MPFTFSHPAAVLPFRIFKKRWFSLTGLVIGSVVPDFEYFLRMKDSATFSHKFWGIWWFDLPLAFIISFLFHNVVRDPLFSNLPADLQRRFKGYIHFSWNQYVRKHLAIVFFSFLVGILSHILWDRLTHETFNFLQQMPDIQQHLFSEMRKKMSYYLLWYGNSFVGAVLILFFIWRWPSNPAMVPNTNTIDYWLFVAFGTLVVFITRIALSATLFIGDYIVSLISAFFLSMIAVSLLKRFHRPNQANM